MKRKSTFGQKIVIAALVAVFAVGSTSSFSAYSFVFAESYEQQINRLQNVNNNKQSRVLSLAEQADDIQGVIGALQKQIDALQSKINKNNAKRDKLQTEIVVAQAELEEQKDLLGQNIRSMYLEGDISTLEMLASSKDLSEFVDKEQYRNSVQEKIKTTLDKINALKLQLSTQKQEVEKILREQEQMRQQVAAQKAEQGRILGMNQTEQANLNQQIEKNREKIADLRYKQFLETVSRFGGGGGQVGGGGYPWGMAPCLRGGHVQGPCAYYEWGYHGSWVNPATGYAFRNCTDYVAWKAGAPAGLGNAREWYGRAPAYSLNRGRQPRKGAAAVDIYGTYGHVMYVEAVNSDGSIIISDYNRAGPGEFGATTLSASTANSLHYVYF